MWTRPVFRTFLSKNGPLIFESLATRGFFYFHFFKALMKKRVNAEELFFHRFRIWTLFFRKILIFKCLWCLIFQRSVRSSFVIKCNVLFHAPPEALFWGVLSAVCLFFFECCKECFGDRIIVWLACSWERLLCTALLQQFFKRSRGVLFAPIAVKDQALGFTALPICVSECSGHKIGTGIARYSPTNNFAREQVENHTKVKPVSIDFKVCNVADPNLIGTLSGKL